MPLLGFTQFIPKIITGLTRQEITEQARQYLLDHCKEAEPGSPLEYAMRLTFEGFAFGRELETQKLNYR